MDADLRTMSKRVESEQYYVTFEMFVADVKRMFANARTYNSPDTIYYKCATRHVEINITSVGMFLLLFASSNSNLEKVKCRLEAHFQSKVQSGLQSGTKLQQ